MSDFLVQFFSKLFIRNQYELVQFITWKISFQE